MHGPSPRVNCSSSITLLARSETAAVPPPQLSAASRLTPTPIAGSALDKAEHNRSSRPMVPGAAPGRRGSASLRRLVPAIRPDRSSTGTSSGRQPTGTALPGNRFRRGTEEQTQTSASRGCVVV